MKNLIVAMAIGIALLGCSAADRSPEVLFLELDEEYGCGYGFHVGSADQTTGLFLEYSDWDRARSGKLESNLAGEEWSAELRFGRDLFANWCDDVFEPGEPDPVVEEVWRLSGHIAIKDLPPAPLGCGGRATASVTDLVAHGPAGETMALEDMALTNEAWGCFAG